MTAIALRRTCEHHPVNESDHPCGCVARFNVTRGRKHDAQHSCRRHLAATVEALMQADSVAVTVTRIQGADQ